MKAKQTQSSSSSSLWKTLQKVASPGRRRKVGSATVPAAIPPANESATDSSTYAKKSTILLGDEQAEMWGDDFQGLEIRLVLLEHLLERTVIKPQESQQRLPQVHETEMIGAFCPELEHSSANDSIDVIMATADLVQPRTAKRHGSIWHKSITASQELQFDRLLLDDAAAVVATKRGMRSRASLVRIANRMEFDEEASFDS